MKKNLIKKLKQIKKVCEQQLPKLKRALLFINRHRELALLLYIVLRVEQLHSKFDIFQETFLAILFETYSKVIDSIAFTQQVFSYFLSIMGIES